MDIRFGINHLNKLYHIFIKLQLLFNFFAKKFKKLINIFRTICGYFFGTSIDNRIAKPYYI